MHAPPPDFLSHSHGEGFLRFFEVRCSRQGIYIFDEPESALSPSRQIEFLKLLRQHRPALAHPTSRGQVRLASANWRDAPVIEPNYLATDHDLDAVVKAIEVARELGRQSAFDRMRDAEVVPGPQAVSRQDLIDLARTASASFGHAVGTAKIGMDVDAVVDSKLRVHGLRGLRVADASVMPSIISGPGTNAASYMIGGRAAELIKADI